MKYVHTLRITDSDDKDPNEHRDDLVIKAGGAGSYSELIDSLAIDMVLALHAIDLPVTEILAHAIICAQESGYGPIDTDPLAKSARNFLSALKTEREELDGKEKSTPCPCGGAREFHGACPACGWPNNKN